MVEWSRREPFYSKTPELLGSVVRTPLSYHHRHRVYNHRHRVHNTSTTSSTTHQRCTKSNCDTPRISQLQRFHLDRRQGRRRLSEPNSRR
ncbi:hypothetical protein DPMN_076430 [Dreissena polymorpha]|uniref:Uncharacterized protein n=1 Tax=Dreissena polymorpha TaxID=45954 RepID=A0A9D3YJ22_DREPO|nr:hypothetical protein DPMN_076430 [Dreissena polymorpha]